MSDAFDRARESADPDCGKCNGTGMFKYDRNHATICDLCCKHDRGWKLLERHYGEKNGLWCCLAGCGRTVKEVPA